MKRKGIAFIDDLIDNAITIGLLVIVFLIVLLASTTSQATMKKNYKTASDALDNEQALIELLRLQGFNDQTIAENLPHADSDAIRTHLETTIQNYFEGVYGEQAAWRFSADYPANVEIKDLTVGKNGLRKDSAELYIPIDTDKVVHIILQSPK